MFFYFLVERLVIAACFTFWVECCGRIGGIVSYNSGSRVSKYRRRAIL